MKGWAVAAILAVLLAGQWWRGEQKDTEGGAALRAAQHSADSLKNLLAQAIIAAEKADTVYRKVRVRVPVKVNIHDTTEVKVYVALADSALKRCDELADSCREVRGQMRERDKAWSAYTDMLSREAVMWRKRYELGPRFESGIGVDRSMVVGDIRVSARGDVRLLGRIHGYVRAEHTFGYPPRSDLRVGFEARP